MNWWIYESMNQLNELLREGTKRTSQRRPIISFISINLLFLMGRLIEKWREMKAIAAPAVLRSEEWTNNEGWCCEWWDCFLPASSLCGLGAAAAAVLRKEKANGGRKKAIDSWNNGWQREWSQTNTPWIDWNDDWMEWKKKDNQWRVFGLAEWGPKR